MSLLDWSITLKSGGVHYALVVFTAVPNLQSLSYCDLNIVLIQELSDGDNPDWGNIGEMDVGVFHHIVIYSSLYLGVFDSYLR